MLRGALTILLMMQSAQGLDEVRNLVEGNILAVHRPELWRLVGALLPVVLLHVMGGRRLLLCSFEIEYCLADVTQSVYQDIRIIQDQLSHAISTRAGVAHGPTRCCLVCLVCPSTCR